jgi:hypothetical protein
MKFLLDENVDLRLAAQLRSLGHDVTAIAKDYPHALSDEDVLTPAGREHIDALLRGQSTDTDGGR